ncbi:fibroblast growth factor 18-like [Xenia sp. Carnegie-2017]|uniref:fibroblast growth factor 18-like n=1 Tax=Xenia sp. Carnegie-2017 TaxID=2897299 RepID=UPI001F04712B|nr:fibroblast growth factor 18-like [Xenia sp. Carnegie-2017]
MMIIGLLILLRQLTKVQTIPLNVQRTVVKTSPSKEDIGARLKRANIPRTSLLYSRHTSKFVKVNGSKIHANANRNDAYAELILTTRGINGEQSIQGKKSKMFICMDKKGKIISMGTFKAQRCTFLHRINDDGYHTFRLLSNQRWFLGFKQNGRLKHGNKTSHDHKAAWLMMETS